MVYTNESAILLCFYIVRDQVARPSSCLTPFPLTTLNFETSFTMRALRYHGIKDLRLDEDVAEPKCGDSQFKIRRET